MADEVSTGRGSDRVISSPRLTLTQIEDPVATAPGTDLMQMKKGLPAPRTRATLRRRASFQEPARAHLPKDSIDDRPSIALCSRVDSGRESHHCKLHSVREQQTLLWQN